MSHGIKTNVRLRCLRPILKKWIELNRKIGRRWTKSINDAPWCYNERALLGMLVRAVWQHGEEAFEEFSDLKRTRKRLTSGRIDLWFSCGNHEFNAEAKRCWIPMTRTQQQSNLIAAVMNHAKADVGRCRPTRWARRLAIVFGVPYLRRGKVDGLAPRLERLVANAKEVEHGAIAWVFPELKRFPRSDLSVYPGIIVWIKEVRRSRR